MLDLDEVKIADTIMDCLRAGSEVERSATAACASGVRQDDPLFGMIAEISWRGRRYPVHLEY